MNTQNDAAAFIAQFRETRAKIEAIPDEGSILFTSETCLAIAIPDGDADKGHITGILFAHVFTRETLRQPFNQIAGLDRQYSDGAGRKFTLTQMRIAKRRSLAQLDSSISMMEGLAAFVVESI